MQMKYIRFIAAGAYAMLALSGCDKIEDESVLLDPPNADDTLCVPDAFPQNTNTARNVLLEEFTGHECPNCPGAAYQANQLKASLATSGKELILVSLHAGSLAVPHAAGSGSFETDFRTEDGNTYNTYFNPSYVPIALINRVAYNASVLVDVADWSAAVNAEFAKPLEVNLQMQVQQDTATGQLCLHVESEFLVSKTGTYNLVIYTVEDSIIDWQYNGPAGDPTYPLSTNISNYLHRHVLRDAVTPAWGTLVASGALNAGDKFITTRSYTLSPLWNKDHIIFVAYIYDDATKEILQTIEFHPSLL